MRFVMATIAVVVLALPAYGRALLPHSVDDQRTLDVCIRRLRQVGEKDAEVVIEHLTPMLNKRGGPIGWMSGRVRIGSKEETELIFRQHARAKSAADRREIGKKVTIGIVRWVWNLAWDLMFSVSPFFTATVAVVLYVLYKRRGAEQFALHRRIELDPIVRQRAMDWADPIVSRGHNRIKRRLTRELQSSSEQQ